jgi:hypothetical protein
VRLGEPWSGPFLSELHSFNGSEQGVDDQVDGLVSANDAALQSGFAPHAFGKMRI